MSNRQLKSTKLFLHVIWAWKILVLSIKQYLLILPHCLYCNSCHLEQYPLRDLNSPRTLPVFKRAWKNWLFFFFAQFWVNKGICQSEKVLLTVMLGKITVQKKHPIFSKFLPKARSMYGRGKIIKEAKQQLALKRNLSFHMSLPSLVFQQNDTSSSLLAYRCIHNTYIYAHKQHRFPLLYKNSLKYYLNYFVPKVLLQEQCECVWCLLG